MIIQKTSEDITEFMGGDFLFWLLVIFALTAFCCFIFGDSRPAGRSTRHRRSVRNTVKSKQKLQGKDK